MSRPRDRKWVYLFKERDGQSKSLLGGKGAGLAELTRAGLPVPQGFIVTTEACNAYTAAGKKLTWSNLSGDDPLAKISGRENTATSASAKP